MATEGEAAKVQRHLELLRQQHRQLQKETAELRTALEASAGAGAAGTSSSFAGRLLELVGRVFDQPGLSDLAVHVGDKTIHCHRLVLIARGGRWLPDGGDLAETRELQLTDISHAVAYELLRFVYTSRLDDAAASKLDFMLELLQATERFQLPDLKLRCEEVLMAAVSVDNCVRLLTVAHDVQAEKLKKFTMEIVMDRWDELNPADFAKLSAQLLYEMIKHKTQFVLHRAIKHSREDVVFLFLIEFDLQLREKLNERDEHGDLPLQIALRLREESIASTLVSHGCDTNAPTADGTTLLHDAIRRGDEFSALFLIKNKANVNACTVPAQETPLHVVAQSSSCTVARQLLASAADVNARRADGSTPLQVAIMAGHSELVELLLDDAKVDVNSRNNEGHTALWLAMGLPTPDVAKTLVSRGCNINITSASGDSMLHYAIESKNARAALFLIENGAAVDLSNKKHVVPLHVAAALGLSSVVEALLNKGAPPHASNDDFQTPLMLALAGDHSEVVELLLGRPGVDVNVRDVEGRTALGLALESGRMAIAHRLIGAGADVEATTPSGMTLLHQAIMRGDAAGAMFLLENGANVEQRTGDNRTPLQLAIAHGVDDVVAALCARGADVNVPDDNGTTPLWLALRSQQEEIATTLVKNGCNVNARATEGAGGLAALHCSIKERDEFSALFLIRNGANVNDQDNETRDAPLHLAGELGFVSVLVALLEQGADVNLQDAALRTPLHRAILAKQTAAIDALLRHPKLNLKLRDEEELTAFGCALKTRDQSAAQQILRRAPDATEDYNSKGMTYLHTAIGDGDGEAVSFLLATGKVNVNAAVQDSAARTALSLAVERGMLEVTKALLQAGAKHNVPDRHSKWTVAHVAASLGFVEILEALIAAKANMNAQDDLGDSVLHAAVRAGHLNAVQVLLSPQAKVDVFAVNQQEQTVLHTLARYPRDNAVQILQALFKRMEGKINPQDAEGNTPIYYAYAGGAATLSKALVMNGAHLGLPNKMGGSCFDVQTSNKMMLFRLIELIPGEQEWVESPTCQVCQVKFSVGTRRHHCRHCGRVLCKKCSSNQVPIVKPGFDLPKPVRVCDDCHTVLNRG